MKKILALLLIITTVGFALPTMQGTRGTNFVSSALCENMGWLWFNMASEGYAETIIVMDTLTIPGDTLLDTFNILAAKPIVSLSFTPWHYLEFAAFGSAFLYRNADPLLTVFNLSDVGGHVKGSIPFGPLDAPTVVGLGIEGFFLMSLPMEFNEANNDAMAQYLGYHPFNQSGAEFGGKLLFSVQSQYISGHLNAGYWYRSLHTIGDVTVQYPQTIIGGVALETSPLSWMNIFADFNLNYGLDMMNADPSLTGIGTYASVGARFPLLMGANKGFGLLFNVGGGADPMNFNQTMSLYAGIAIGGDLIPDKAKTVEGLVVDAEDGSPIEDAVIEVITPEGDTVVYSDSLGMFELPELKGDEIIRISKDGYHGETISGDEVLAGEIDLLQDTKLDPVKKSYLAFIVSDAETSEPLEATMWFEKVEQDTTINPLTTDAVTGYAKLEIPPGKYNVTTTADDYLEDTQTFTIKPGTDTIVDILLDHVPVEETVIVIEPPPTLYPATLTGFDRGQRQLTIIQMQELEKVVELMKANPDATVIIVGHTDSVGSDASNVDVGYSRAKSVADFMAMRGIDIRRIRVESAGERFPVADNRYRSGRAANRRVELVFSNQMAKGGDGGDHGVKPPTTK